ncbi:MAG: tRNA (adenine-N1)-methyltransferase [Promethearchaeota archaeon]
MDSEIIKENDLIFLVLDNKKRWLVQVRSGETFHTHRGIIEFDDIIGKPFGSVIFSRPYDKAGYRFYILKPLATDYILYMSRKTQIIYPEDAGLIILYSGIGPGSIIIEAGTGSGALTCLLGTYIRPNGHIYSYDIREKALKHAKRNVARAQLGDVITIQQGNILKDKFPYKNVDAVVLDMPCPWLAIPQVKDSIKLSGSIVSFSPTMEQIKKTTRALFDTKEFIDIKTYELMKRSIQVKENATRPESRMVGHTGYITFGRKIQKVKNPYRGKKPDKEELIDMKDMPLRS